MTEKKRLDILLTETGQADSREKAKAIIMSGIVYVNQQKADKPGFFCSDHDIVEVRGHACPYVSRGGLKLERALDIFSEDPKGKVVLDVGASTGGFSDCLLQRGASKIYAVDVGYGQLAWKIRTDPRVVTMERTNIRYVTAEQFPQPFALAVIDVSFISLKLVLPKVRELLNPDGEVIALIKPQFEAGREQVGKKGVVRDQKVHVAVIYELLEFVKSIGFTPAGLTYSPVKGPEGNIEFLLFLSPNAAVQLPALEELVEEAQIRTV